MKVFSGLADMKFLNLSKRKIYKDLYIGLYAMRHPDGFNVRVPIKKKFMDISPADFNEVDELCCQHFCVNLGLSGLVMDDVDTTNVTAIWSHKMSGVRVSCLG